MAAEILATAGMRVTVYDRMPSVGRKLLMAGRSGLNLTHSEGPDAFLARYGLAAPRLGAALAAFPPDALRRWAEALGQETFVGSSGRVFPRSWKASPLLRAWLARLDALDVEVRPRHRWTGFTPDGALALETPDGDVTVAADATVLALGGASWPRLGSDGSWQAALRAAGVASAPFRPANCGLRVAWSDRFRSAFAGRPLKRVAISAGGGRWRGDAVVTATGLEGGAIYAASATVRDALLADGYAILTVDLRPDLSADALAGSLARPRGKQSGSTFLRKAAGLSPLAIALLHEAAGPTEATGPALPRDPAVLAALIKAVPLPVTGTDTLARAISSAGGIRLDETDETFMLRGRPGVFCAGEMLDWEAPTGGYLLQACFATGAAAGQGAISWLQR